tara:strand:- start:3066 stop:3260 length:195 start_codon:yes stop_codon:yes gene_type:complete
MANIINVGRWMGEIRNRARLVVISEELKTLESDLVAGKPVTKEGLDRLKSVRDLVHDMATGDKK